MERIGWKSSLLTHASAGFAGRRHQQDLIVRLRAVVDMQLLSILESALLLVKEDHRHGELYYKILSVRYFNTCFRSNEDAFLALGMASSTYYRHSKKAVRMYAAYLWCIIIPDLILKQMQNQSTSPLAES